MGGAEPANRSTALKEKSFQSLQSSSITDPKFYTYALNFLLRESHFRQPHHLLDGPLQGKAKTLSETKTLHAQIVKNGFPLSGNLGNALIDLHIKCGNLGLTLKTFNQLEKQEVIAWNSIWSAYTRHGMHEEAVCFFGSMWGTNCQPNQFTYAIALLASARLVDLTFEFDDMERREEGGVQEPATTVEDIFFDGYEIVALGKTRSRETGAKRLEWVVGKDLVDRNG